MEGEEGRHGVVSRVLTEKDYPETQEFVACVQQILNRANRPATVRIVWTGRDGQGVPGEVEHGNVLVYCWSTWCAQVEIATGSACAADEVTLLVRTDLSVSWIPIERDSDLPLWVRAKQRRVKRRGRVNSKVS